MAGATQYISRIALEVNGQEIEDFMTFTEKEVELARPVKLMGKTGHANTVARYQAQVDYVIPADVAEFDFTQLTAATPGTLTVDRLNRTRITFRGVVTLKIGDLEYDSEKEAKKKITFGATSRVTS